MYNDYFNQNNGTVSLKEQLLSAWQQYKQPALFVGGCVALAWFSAKVVDKLANKFKSNCKKPENTVNLTVDSEKAPLNLTVEESIDTVESTVQEQYSDEDIEREMMRQTMSLLGKRSAEARRLRKLNAE